jgi:UDP-N-acetyl-D-mannosaminuronic acid dehydrogenase
MRGEVAVVGGCGRAGLPLGLAFAAASHRVVLVDIDHDAVARVASGRMPFHERGAVEALGGALRAGFLRASTDPAAIADADAVIVAVGTPSFEAAGNRDAVVAVVRGLAVHLRPHQLVVLRSTVPVGTTTAAEEALRAEGRTNTIVYCPERSAEGCAIEEVGRLPVLVGARSAAAGERARTLFAGLGAPCAGIGSPEEIELAKLFANAYRYAHFAIANELYMIADNRSLDYERIRALVTADYPRAASLPRAGLTAGPCLPKDAAMVAEESPDGPGVNVAAAAVNDRLPQHLVDRLSERHPLDTLVVGVLGVAFKGGADDVRGSLALRLVELLVPRCREVLVSDPHVRPDGGVTTDELLARCDVVVIGAPHPDYAALAIDVPVVDLWGVTRGAVG